MKYIWILSITLGTACTNPVITEYKVEDYERPMKYCKEECLRESFTMFHNLGRSWGTGSSSMNGLSQTQIFDRVIKYCENYYSGEICCERPSDDFRKTVITSHQHGYDYGPCRK